MKFSSTAAQLTVLAALAASAAALPTSARSSEDLVARFAEDIEAREPSKGTVRCVLLVDIPSSYELYP